MMSDDLYEDIQLKSENEQDTINRIHNEIDLITTMNTSSLEHYDEVEIPYEEVIDKLSDEQDRYDESIQVPDRFEISHEKWRKNPDISDEQRVLFDANRSFFGSHVPNSNTKRGDNLRHLMDMELTEMYNRIPTRRHRGTFIKQMTVSEFQMCRSNPEIGGFDRKMDRSILKREDVDVRQLQTLQEGNNNKKRSSMLKFLGSKKGN